MASVCPECSSAAVYYGGTECASCGWHKPMATTMHANYRPDPTCVWCYRNGDCSWLVSPR